jgi:hypothetical protein
VLHRILLIYQFTKIQFAEVLLQQIEFW